MMNATLTLMAWGASTDAKNTEGKTPFDVSDGHNVRTRMTAIRRILVFPLHAACEMGAAPECIRLLEQGWDPLALNARNQTPQRLARLNFRDEVDHIMQSWLARHRALAALDDALGGGHGPGEPGRRTVSL